MRFSELRKIPDSGHIAICFADHQYISFRELRKIHESGYLAYCLKEDKYAFYEISRFLKNFLIADTLLTVLQKTPI